jgi:L-asparaginase
VDTNVAIIKMFPEMSEAVLAIYSIKGLKGIVLETYGSGNARQKIGFKQLMSRLYMQVYK